MLDNFDKNKNPFKVPENYFRDFNVEIMEKLPAKAKRVPLWRKMVPATAVAAVFGGILFLSGIFNNHSSVTDQSVADRNISVASSGIAASDEEDYYSFIEDEVFKSKYKEIVYNN